MLTLPGRLLFANSADFFFPFFSKTIVNIYNSEILHIIVGVYGGMEIILGIVVGILICHVFSILVFVS